MSLERAERAGRRRRAVPAGASDWLRLRASVELSVVEYKDVQE